MVRGAWKATWGRKELDMTDRLHFHRGQRLIEFCQENTLFQQHKGIKLTSNKKKKTLKNPPLKHLKLKLTNLVLLHKSDATLLLANQL